MNWAFSRDSKDSSLAIEKEVRDRREQKRRLIVY
jgi:hypothetical protein